MSDILAFGTGMTVELGQYGAGWLGMTVGVAPRDEWSAEPETGGMRLEMGHFSVGSGWRGTGVAGEPVQWSVPQRPARARWVQSSGKPVDWED